MSSARIDFFKEEEQEEGGWGVGWFYLSCWYESWEVVS